MAETKGANIRNNTKRTIVIAEYKLKWKPAGQKGEIQYVSAEDFEKPLVQELLAAIDPNTGNHKAEIVNSKAVADKAKEYANIPSKEGEYFGFVPGGIQSTVTTSVRLCNGVEENGARCAISTNDPNAPKPYFCTRHEYQRESGGIIAKEKVHQEDEGKSKKTVKSEHVLNQKKQIPGAETMTATSADVFKEQTMSKLQGDQGK